MEITREQYDKFMDEQIGKTCSEHGKLIRAGRWGNFCPTKLPTGQYCTGNKYPTNGEQLTIIQ